MQCIAAGREAALNRLCRLMSYQFQPGKLYRMPTHFGPSMGPRQGPDGRRYECREGPKVTAVAVNFLTNREQLSALLPERFEVGPQPMVTVYATYMTDIEWLAGRGYNTLGVTFPAVFRGEVDRVSGQFLAVLWENLADPIITGREELGFAKIYCELPDPKVQSGEMHCQASWLGFTFLELIAENLKPQSRDQIEDFVAGQTGDGRLHYKYIPMTGQWGEADAEYAVLTPAATPNQVIEERSVGEGTVRFHSATWEELPTLFHIVNTLGALEIKQYLGASVTKMVGMKDLRDQRILR